MTADEFVLVMAILGQCKVADTVSGQQQLVELVAEQCNFSQPFSPSDQENIDRIIICMKHGLPYFSVSLYFIFKMLCLVIKLLLYFHRLKSNRPPLFLIFVIKFYRIEQESPAAKVLSKSSISSSSWRS